MTPPSFGPRVSGWVVDVRTLPRVPRARQRGEPDTDAECLAAKHDQGALNFDDERDDEDEYDDEADALAEEETGDGPLPSGTRLPVVRTPKEPPPFVLPLSPVARVALVRLVQAYDRTPAALMLAMKNKSNPPTTADTSARPDAEPLTDAEQQAFQEAERTISENWQSWLEVSASLVQIRDTKSYQADGYPTFEAFCKGAFNIPPEMVALLNEMYPPALPTRRGRPPARSKSEPLGDHLLFASNPVHGAAVTSLARVPEWKPDAANGYAYSLRTETPTNGGERIALFGIADADGPKVRSLGELLAKGGAPWVKVYYALAARWYKAGGIPGQAVTVDLNQFCDDLGYKRNKGGHKPDRKRKAVEVLTALTSVEMTVQEPHPDKRKRAKGMVLRLRGKLWERGILAEEGYADLFGAALEGDPDTWEPLAFRYRPGEWSSDPDFCTYYGAMGRFGAGLLQLENDKDQWAILVGGYLGTLIRTNQYAARRIRAGTILQKVGLAQSPNEKRNAARSKAAFERALDRLREVGVIKVWTWPEIDASEPDDPDDLDALAAYAADESAVWPGNEWRRKLVLIEWPDATHADRDRLHTATAKRVKNAQDRAARLQARNTAIDNRIGEQSAKSELPPTMGTD